jgi:hypothetical protein
VDTVTISAVRRDDPARRVRVTLGLRDRADGQPFLSRAPSYACAIRPLDGLASTYGPQNWESGVLSGAGYAWRRWLGDRQGLLLVELEGALGGDGIEAIAQATSAALAALLNREPPHPAAPAWEIQAHPAPVNGPPAAPDAQAGTPAGRPGA